MAAMLSSKNYHRQIQDMRRGEYEALSIEIAEIKRALGIKD
jgi:hypothetical protein